MVRQPEPKLRRPHRRMEHIRRRVPNQFEDSQRETTARGELQKLEMTWPLVDKYVSNFEKLARQAGYNHTNPETMHYFMGGLPRSVLTDVLQPHPYHLPCAESKSNRCSTIQSPDRHAGQIQANRQTTEPELVPAKEPATTTTKEPTSLQPATVQLKHSPAQLQQSTSPNGLRTQQSTTTMGPTNQRRTRRPNTTPPTRSLFQLWQRRPLRQRLPTTQTNKGQRRLGPRTHHVPSTTRLGLPRRNTDQRPTASRQLHRRTPRQSSLALPRG
jgi:hypothetical protein